jgi:hypothetical protein
MLRLCRSSLAHQVGDALDLVETSLVVDLIYRVHGIGVILAD